MPLLKPPRIMFVIWVEGEDGKLYIRHCTDREENALAALETFLQFGLTTVWSQYQIASQFKELPNEEI